MIKQLEPYVSYTYFNKEKVFYLNKSGRDLIGSVKEVKRNSNMEHTLFRNEVYLHYNCPMDWKNEVQLTYEIETGNSHGIVFNNRSLNARQKKMIVADAVFTRNGYMYIVEVDNLRDMKDNHRKVQIYAELFNIQKADVVKKLEVFTTTKNRKQKFEKWLQEYKIRGEVYLYEEVR